jgi:PTH2 family peptidyl-tRNA hydrolase
MCLSVLFKIIDQHQLEKMTASAMEKMTAFVPIDTLAMTLFASVVGFAAWRASHTREMDYDSLEDDSCSEDEGDIPLKDNYGLMDAPYKMLLCVNQGLGMAKGKIGAQCGHATLGAYKRAVRETRSAVRWWERTGQAKVAVKARDADHLHEVRARAAARGLVTYIVRDAGKTQIAAGSETVLAIGPAPVRCFEGITDDLKLL